MNTETTEAQPNLKSLETIVSLAKRRGFVFPSSEIYGGFASCYDYGPLGVEVKRNVKDAWWRSMVRLRDDVVGLDASILMHPRVWEASGHVGNFHDQLVECKKCNLRIRVDKMDELDQIATGASKNCKHEWSEPKNFDLMFKTHLGPVADSANIVYLRPETAQGIFVNYANILDSTRVKIPFGVAQQGKSFRNEVTTRRFTFRTCEFEQMELEFFVKPDAGEEWFKYWREARMQWFKDIGVSPARIRFRNHDSDELAHYSKACTDIEYLFPFGWSEVEGIAWRGDYDLKQHSMYSKKQLDWKDQVTGESFVPHVVEPSIGVDRTILTLLCDAYKEEEVEGNTRVVMKFNPRIAPYKVAVFPLFKKDGHPEKATQVYRMLQDRYMTVYDDGGSIGKRYRRQDEAGTPVCLTIDHQTIEDDTVTLRDRDTLEQKRVKIDALLPTLSGLFGF